VIGGIGLSGSPGVDEECVNAGIEKVKQYCNKKAGLRGAGRNRIGGTSLAGGLRKEALWQW